MVTVHLYLEGVHYFEFKYLDLLMDCQEITPRERRRVREPGYKDDRELRHANLPGRRTRPTNFCAGIKQRHRSEGFCPNSFLTLLALSAWL
jgi:hypothetical protein